MATKIDIKQINDIFWRTASEHPHESETAFRFLIEKLKKDGLKPSDVKIELNTGRRLSARYAERGSGDDPTAIIAQLESSLAETQRHRAHLQEQLIHANAENIRLAEAIDQLERRKGKRKGFSDDEKQMLLESLPKPDPHMYIPRKLAEMLDDGTFSRLETTLRSVDFLSYPDCMPVEEFQRYIAPFKRLTRDYSNDLRTLLMKMNKRTFAMIFSERCANGDDVTLTRATVFCLRAGVLYKRLAGERYCEIQRTLFD
jgi:hypothetical protein